MCVILAFLCYYCTLFGIIEHFLVLLTIEHFFAIIEHFFAIIQHFFGIIQHFFAIIQHFFAIIELLYSIGTHQMQHSGPGRVTNPI